MKTSAWIVAAGLALGVTAVAIAASAPAPSAPSPCAPDDKADLTPRYKTGQVISFKQHTVRKDTMTIGNLPVPVKPDDKPADAGKEPPKPDAPKSDAPKSDPAKTDPAKPDAPKPEAPKAEPAKSEPPKAPSGPMSSTQTVDQTATYELRVTEASEQGASMDLELKSIVCSAELPQGKFSWDSSAPADDKDAKNPVLVAFRPIVGAVLKIKIGPDGNITGVEPDARVNISGGGPLAPMVQQLVSADGVRLRFGSVLWIKDGREPASASKPWTNSDEMFFKAVGKFTYATTNTLKSVKDDAAQIDITGEVKLEGLEPGKPPAGTLKDQSLKGSCVWDPKAGLVKSHHWDQKTTINLKVAGTIDVVRVSDFVVTTTRE